MGGPARTRRRARAGSRVRSSDELADRRVSELERRAFHPHVTLVRRGRTRLLEPRAPARTGGADRLECRTDDALRCRESSRGGVALSRARRLWPLEAPEGLLDSLACVLRRASASAAGRSPSGALTFRGRDRDRCRAPISATTARCGRHPESAAWAPWGRPSPRPGCRRDAVSSIRRSCRDRTRYPTRTRSRNRNRTRVHRRRGGGY